MISVTMKELLEAGVHFGHQTKSWNPKMKNYIFGQRNGIYIIDLQKTMRIFKESLMFVEDAVAKGKEVLFVGTKKQAQDILKEYAEKCESHYVNQRWLGGLLTNFGVIRSSVEKLIEMDEMKEDGRWDLLSKKEQSRMDKVFRKLTKNLGGIKNMTKLPGIMFVIDSTKEDIAILEAQRLKIPVVSIVDTNGDPDGIDYPIPGNDDALRAIELFTMKISEAVLEGKKKKLAQELQETQTDEEPTPEEQAVITEEQSAFEELKEEPKDASLEPSVPQEVPAEKKEEESPEESEKTEEGEN
ncbi:MAG: 30S ribosomal protein S2 [Candidatus Aminicenantes bacterium]|nr:30S ribosomal protein S2 [Candidatus Aminicenantes bacterium]